MINNFKTHRDSNYINYCWNIDSSYLIYECGTCKDVFYSEECRKVSNSLDVSLCTRSEYCYYSVNLFDCYQLLYSVNSQECKNSYFLRDCIDCEYCINCRELKHKKFCIDNIQYSEEEYHKRKDAALSRLDVSDIVSGLYKWKSFYWKNNENVTWNYIYNSKNSLSCYNVKNLEDSKYCSHLWSSSKISRDCYDYNFFGWSELVYEAMTVGGLSQKVRFCVNTWETAYDNIYCNMCFACKSIFWCVGLKYKEYCIFNKQYTKQEYEILVPKIIECMIKNGEWWEFFPISIAPFWYNETLAQEYYPLMEKEVWEAWWEWSDYQAPFPKVDKIIKAKNLPENISDIPDDILNWAIECESTKRPFRIIRQELEFYRKHNIPVPKRHPDQRYLDRLELRK